MPYQEYDEELERLRSLKEEAKSNLDDAGHELDEAKSHRREMKSTYGSQLDQLKYPLLEAEEEFKKAKYEVDCLRYDRNKHAVQLAQACLKRWRERRQILRSERDVALSAIRDAKERYERALGDFNARKADYFAAKDAYNLRLQELENQIPRRNWQPRRGQPPDVGIIDETGQLVSFKTGSNDHLLIREGDYGNHDDSAEGRRQAAEFNTRGHHDHYGNDDRTGRRFERRRGYYNDPSENNS